MEKPRLPRIERSEHYEVEDETAHLWAVSYADFLMVLLSFFILFFSVDEEARENVIQEITRVTFDGGGKEKGHFQREPSFAEPQASASLYEQFAQLDVKVEKAKDQLIIHFPTNLYAVGQVELPPEGVELLKTIQSNLGPYLDKIDLVMIGHSDSLQFTKFKHKYLRSNFDLSSLRGSRAVKAAIELGIQPTHLFTQGAATNERNSRTLSIMLRPHKIKPPEEEPSEAKSPSAEEESSAQAEPPPPAEEESSAQAEPPPPVKEESSAQAEPPPPAEETIDEAKSLPQRDVAKVATSEPKVIASNEKHYQYWVQVASHYKSEDAYAHIERLEKIGYRPQHFETQVNGKSWYRVRLGPFTTRQEALNEKSNGEKYKVRFFDKSFLVMTEQTP